MVILLIATTVLVTVTVVEAVTATNLGVTSTIVAVGGTVSAPLVAWVKESWIFLGTNFAYIVGFLIGFSAITSLFWVFIAYQLFWKKVVQQKILGKSITKRSVDSSKQPAPAPSPLPLAPTEQPPLEKPQEA